MHETLYIVIGLLIILAAVIDLVWTTLGTHGGGPLSGRVLAFVWTMAVKLHRRRPSHRALSFLGAGLLPLIVTMWLTLLWAGCSIAFLARPDSVVDLRTHAATSPATKFLFIGDSMFTLGTSGYAANGPLWHLASVLTAAMGLGAVTLSITFLLQVLTSVVTKRTLGAYISDVGGTPLEIINRSWTGERFYGLDGHMSMIAGLLHTVTEQHLAYPVLHYFHSEKLRTASTVRIAGLYEMTLVLEHGVVPHLRLPRISIYPLRDALAGYHDVLGGTFVESSSSPPPPPALDPIREFGIETVDDAEFAAATEKFANIRRFFLGLLREDGWSWEDISRR